MPFSETPTESLALIRENTAPSTTRARSYKGVLSGFALAVQFSVQSVARTHVHRHACDTKVLLVGECMKLLVSLLMCAYEWTDGYRRQFDLVHWARAMLPCVGFVIGNSIGLYCTSLVDSTTFVILTQLKIVFTVMFAYVLCNERISRAKVFCLIVLILGVISVSVGRQSETLSPERTLAYFIGASGLILETILSAGISICLQSILQAFLWPRNVQLATLSAHILAVALALDPRCSEPLFRMTFRDLLLSVSFAGGGVLVALTLHYAGAVEKTVATSLSVAGTTIAEALLFGQVPSIQTSVAVLNVIASSVAYVVLK